MGGLANVTNARGPFKSSTLTLKDYTEDFISA